MASPAALARLLWSRTKKKGKRIALKGERMKAGWNEYVRPGRRRPVSKGASRIVEAADAGAKALTMATFAPIAAIGYPAMALGTKGVKLAGKGAWHTGVRGFDVGVRSMLSRGGRTSIAIGAAAGFTGLAMRSAMGNEATRVRQRDPANAMGMSQSLHYAHGNLSRIPR